MQNWIVRPVVAEDQEALFELASLLGSGMTTFPADREAISTKAQASGESFKGQRAAADSQYLLALEDLDTETIVGVSAVYPEIGRPYGFFSWHIDRLVSHSDDLGLSLDCRVLNFSNAYTGCTEVGTLVVNPECRKGGAGQMLAKARYMLMASFPGLFAETAIAEMRGWQAADGSSPIWSAIGNKFFDLDFDAADKLSAVRGSQFIADLFPRSRIYADLLPADAQECLGKAHDTSRIAMQMLLKEGFSFDNYIDIFDGGPQVSCRVAEIDTVRKSLNVKVRAASSREGDAIFLICTNSLQDFRMVRARATLVDGELFLPGDLIRTMNVAEGDMVRQYQLASA